MRYDHRFEDPGASRLLFLRHLEHIWAPFSPLEGLAWTGFKSDGPCERGDDDFFAVL